jgi:hypothetical protein
MTQQPVTVPQLVERAAREILERELPDAFADQLHLGAPQLSGQVV